MIFKGNEIIPSIGFRILYTTAKTSPLTINVVNPPFTFTPDNAWVKTNKEKALIKAALSKDFILSPKSTKSYALCQQICYYVGVMSKPNLSFERKLWNKNIKYVIGIDEVGRGAFAGPIIAAGVIFPQTKRITKKFSFLKDVNDSKLLKANVRRRLAKKIKTFSMHWAIEEVNIQTINKIGIGRANKMVFRKVVKNLLSQIGDSEKYFLFCDGYPVKNIKKIGLSKQLGIIDGDNKSITIAAASIIAKVHRDSLMRKLGRSYPFYKFAKNKGYGTKAHQNALKMHGLSKIHRKSFNLQVFLNS